MTFYMSRFLCPLIFDKKPFTCESDESDMLKRTMKRCISSVHVSSVSVPWSSVIGVVFHFVKLDDNTCYRVCYLHYLSIVFHFVKLDVATYYMTCYLQYVSV